jgi:hypothetical protein
MKARNFSIILMITLFFSGCVVYSFYPLYEEDDLFENDLLTGEWIDDEESEWSFTHPVVGKKGNKIPNKKSYLLNLKTKDDGKVRESVFNVHVIKIADQYFLDFYLEDYVNDDEIELSSFHIIPVHTFAKLTIQEDTLQINWFDQEWLKELIEENKIRIHHENNGDFILLTAKPKELQKFVSKYVNSEEAFKDGLEAVLIQK